MVRETRQPMRPRRRKRTSPGILLLLLTAALLILCLEIRRINARLDVMQTRIRQIEGAAAQPEQESESLPDTAEERDYINTLPTLDVGKPVERTEDEVLEHLTRLGKENPVIAGIAASYADYPIALLTALANNPEMADFAAGYPASAGSGSAGELPADGLTQNERAQSCPLLLQWDPRWGYHSYGAKSCVALSGCGPACLSMVLFSLTGDASLTPDKIADYSTRNGYYVDASGTAWALMEDLPEEYGVRVSKPSASEAAMKALLDNGSLIICAMSRGDFTLAGHFIVIRGYDREGFLVNDPNCLSRSRRHWTFSQLKPQIKGIWAYTKAQAQTSSYMIREAG